MSRTLHPSCRGALFLLLGDGFLPCMGLILRSRLNPTARSLNYAYHRLPTRMNVHVLHRDLLLALAAMAIERVEQHCEGASPASKL
jgi:hypothetical protein